MYSELDIFSAEFTQDPTKRLGEIRDISPMWWWETDTGAAWVATSHEAVRQTVFSKDTSASLRYSDLWVDDDSDDLFPRLMRSCVFGATQQDHRRLRRIVNGPFSTKALAGHRSAISTICNSLLDDAEADAAANGGICDWRTVVARRYPLRCIAAICGIDEAQEAPFFEHAMTMTNIISPHITADEFAAVIESTEVLCHITDEVVASVKSQMGTTGQAPDNMIGQLVAEQAAGTDITDDEIRAMVIVICIAGSMNVVDLFTHGLSALINDPAAMSNLVADPTTAMSVSDEMLRISAPSKMLNHFAVVDTTIAGQQVQSGQTIHVAIGTANRDPNVFEHPDRFWPGRPDAAKAMPFGGGAHQCLGTHISRIEGEIMLQEMVRRFPQMSQVGDLSWDPSHIVLRPVTEMRVRLRP